MCAYSRAQALWNISYSVALLICRAGNKCTIGMKTLYTQAQTHTTHCFICTKSYGIKINEPNKDFGVLKGIKIALQGMNSWYTWISYILLYTKLCVHMYVHTAELQFILERLNQGWTTLYIYIIQGTSCVCLGIIKYIGIIFTVFLIISYYCGISFISLRSRNSISVAPGSWKAFFGFCFKSQRFVLDPGNQDSLYILKDM